MQTTTAHTLAYLVLLLKAVAVRGLHEVDVLQQVGHADGGVQLPGLVRGLGTLAVVSGDVQKAAVLRSRAGVVLVYEGKTQALQCTARIRAFLMRRTAGVEPFLKERACSGRSQKCLYSPVIGTMWQPSRKRTERQRLRETSGHAQS